MAVSLVAMGLLLVVLPAPAQEAPPPAASPYASPAANEPARILHFTKEPYAPPPARPESTAEMIPSTGSEASEQVSTSSALPPLVPKLDDVLPVNREPAKSSSVKASATLWQRMFPFHKRAKDPASSPAAVAAASETDFSIAPQRVTPPPKATSSAPLPTLELRQTPSWDKESRTPPRMRSIPSGTLQPVAFQVPPASTRVPGEDTTEYQVQLEPPGFLRLFGRLDSESTLQERMRQEARERPSPERVVFPEEPVLSRERYVARTYPRGNMVVEPNYVCYGRLYFEKINSERYGWELGYLQPFVSAAGFYWDLLTLPYDIGAEPCRLFECSAGYCLPGDPVPLRLYPPILSVAGLGASAAVAVPMFAFFP